MDNGLKCKFYKIKDLEIGFGLKCDVFIAECAMKITMYNKYLMLLTQKGYDKGLTSKKTWLDEAHIFAIWSMVLSKYDKGN